MILLDTVPYIYIYTLRRSNLQTLLNLEIDHNEVYTCRSNPNMGVPNRTTPPPTLSPILLISSPDQNYIRSFVPFLFKAEVQFSDITFADTDKIEDGGQGTVYKALWKPYNKKVAVKVLLTNSNAGKREVSQCIDFISIDTIIR